MLKAELSAINRAPEPIDGAPSAGPAAEAVDVDTAMTAQPGDDAGSSPEKIAHAEHFDDAFHLEQNPDLHKAGTNPAVNYITTGLREDSAARPNLKVAASAPATYGGLPFESVRELVKEHFDEEFYLSKDPALRAANVDPIRHYCELGWREMRDPSLQFSTAYYLESNPNLRKAGLNPLLHYVQHGMREGRQVLPRARRLEFVAFRPLVSVIVPNYNHKAFLAQRLNSILRQTYQNIEVLVLDYCSTDRSMALIKEYEHNHPERIRSILNEKNSGRAFSQWRKGMENTKGDLIWICESDDFCEPDFLEKLVPQFADPSVLLGFGRVQFTDSAGRMVEGLDDYRESAEAGIWNDIQVRPAKDWFCHAFGVSNVIANVGGCLIRRQPVPDDVWDEAGSFHVLGDWYFYLMLANGGRIAYVPDAVAYFRQHGADTSVKAYHGQNFYLEQERVLKLLRTRWDVSEAIARKFYTRVEETYTSTNAQSHVGKLNEFLDVERCMAVPRTARHILVAFHGFHLGGGEFFAIHLANALLRQGFLVSALCLQPTNPIESMRKTLDSRIAVYDADLVREIGVKRFLDTAGVDLISSHIIGAEFFFFVNNREPIDTPYVATLHGSYEASKAKSDALLKFIRGVSHWVYLAEKNLAHLKGIPLADSAISHIGSGMPLDMAPFEQTRGELGIGTSDFVFTLVSRAMPEKGWEEAIQAFLALQARSEQKMYLLFCGSGDEADRLAGLYGHHPNVRFLGFQSRVHGVYRLSDCALLPSRFVGESYPLTLIQAMQVGTPIVATRLGEIETMTTGGDSRAGILIEPDPDNVAFVESLGAAMEKMLNPEFRSARAQDALNIGQRYSIDVMAESYASLFNRVIDEKLTARRKEHIGKDGCSNST